MGTHLSYADVAEYADVSPEKYAVFKESNNVCCCGICVIAMFFSI